MELKNLKKSVQNFVTEEKFSLKNALKEKKLPLIFYKSVQNFDTQAKFSLKNLLKEKKLPLTFYKCEVIPNLWYNA